MGYCTGKPIENCKRENEKFSFCENGGRGRLVANKINKTSSKTDRYTALEKFLSKINPEWEALFQYPKKNWRPWDKVWYKNRPLGSKQAVNDDEKQL